jgi:hypothetical protein
MIIAFSSKNEKVFMLLANLVFILQNAFGKYAEQEKFYWKNSVLRLVKKTLSSLST